MGKQDYNDKTFEAFLRRYGRVYDRAANDRAIAEKQGLVKRKIASQRRAVWRGETAEVPIELGAAAKTISKPMSRRTAGIRSHRKVLSVC